MKVLSKDPDAVWPAKVDLKAYTNGREGADSAASNWLEDGETISSIDTTFVVPTGELAIDSASATDTNTTVTIWLSGGVAGKRYKVTTRVTTSSGRTDDFPFYVDVAEK